MTQKADLYNALKATGAQLTTTYARYKVEDLQAELKAVGVQQPEPEPAPEHPQICLLYTSDAADD